MAGAAIPGTGDRREPRNGSRRMLRMHQTRSSAGKIGESPVFTRVPLWHSGWRHFGSSASSKPVAENCCRCVMLPAQCFEDADERRRTSKMFRNLKQCIEANRTMIASLFWIAGPAGSLQVAPVGAGGRWRRPPQRQQQDGQCGGEQQRCNADEGSHARPSRDRCGRESCGVFPGRRREAGRWRWNEAMLGTCGPVGRSHGRGGASGSCSSASARRVSSASSGRCLPSARSRRRRWSRSAPRAATKSRPGPNQSSSVVPFRGGR